MANTAKQAVFDVFESLIREKTALSATLEAQWLLDAIAEYGVELDELTYDSTSGTFNTVLPQATITTLGYMMKISYLRREVSRVNKMNNIITKDLSLNGNGDSKRFTREELLEELAITKDLVNKQKTSYYTN